MKTWDISAKFSMFCSMQFTDFTKLAASLFHCSYSMLYKAVCLLGTDVLLVYRELAISVRMYSDLLLISDVGAEILFLDVMDVTDSLFLLLLSGALTALGGGSNFFAKSNKLLKLKLYLA